MLFVEGGGDNNHALATACRKGFRKFLEKTGSFTGRMPRIVACGGRGQAYKRFCSAFREAQPCDSVVLLVDSEAPVSQTSSWKHVAQRQGDGWQQPGNATDEQLHLMIECMESWFLADPHALEEFFGQGFQRSALPPGTSLESVQKQGVYDALKQATRNTQGGPYGKGKHSFALLARVDPNKVRAAAPSADRLLNHLDEVL
ncbi:MAG: DUF4276 family protein [Deltaproteobacteria bacterium]|nr:DUF4276 family protein [Deltaproteobacteria bacterium]